MTAAGVKRAGFLCLLSSYSNIDINQDSRSQYKNLFHDRLTDGYWAPLNSYKS